MENKEKPAVITRIVAGGIAGATETIISYPAEFVKTRRQLPQFSHNNKSSLSILKSTYNSSGLSGFYSGCGALVMSNALKSGIRFFTFEASREYFDKVFATKQGQRSPWVNVLAGLSAGVVESLLVVTPGEALKTRLIEDSASKGLQRFAGESTAAAAAIVVREEGIRVLWRGALPVLSKQATNSGVRFTSFGMMQEYIAKTWPSSTGNVGTTLGIGALSGVVTVYASMPFDNIKTRLQSSRAEYRGMIHCAADCVRNEGIRTLWRGTTPRLVRLTLSSSITFAVYDQVVQFANVFRKGSYSEFGPI